MVFIADYKVSLYVWFIFLPNVPNEFATDLVNLLDLSHREGYIERIISKFDFEFSTFDCLKLSTVT